MTTERTKFGREIEAAMGEVLAHVRDETALAEEMPTARCCARLRRVSHGAPFHKFGAVRPGPFAQPLPKPSPGLAGVRFSIG